MALTRAQEELHLTTAANRTIFGKTMKQTASRFVDEIPPELIEKTEHQPRKSKKQVKQMTLF